MFRFWRTLIAFTVILLLCLIPGKDIQKIDFLRISYEDLVVHLGMFSTFSFFLYRDLLKNFPVKIKPGRITRIVFMAGFFLGFFTEFLQFLFARLQRTANPVDFLFDLLGTGLGIMAMRFIKLRSDSSQ